MTDQEARMLSDVLIKAMKAAFPPAAGPARSVGGGAKTKGGKEDSPQRIRASAKSLDSLEASANSLDQGFKRLNRTVRATTKGLASLARSTSGKVNQAASVDTASVAAGATAAAEANKDVAKAADVAATALDKIITPLAKVKIAFSAVSDLLRGPVSDVLRDYYSLLGKGVSGSSNLIGLYKDAAIAGMSLQEYTALLQENSAAVVRSNSLDDFNRTISGTTKQLNGLGIFGASAANLAATMASSTVTLGIPMAQQNAAMNAQIDTFNDLRKTTMLTADGFRELVADISSNQNVQEELLGLAPAERAARSAQLVQGASLGHQLGLTKDASKQLQSALLDQRKLTAKQRFGAAGSIRQAGALVGMSSADTQELAKLSMVKNKDAAQMARFTELSGNLKSGLETLQNSDNIGLQNAADMVTSKLVEAGQGQILDIAGVAKLATEAGKPANADLGTKTGEKEQAFGNALVLLTGLAQNPVIQGVGLLAGQASQLAALFVINKTLMAGFASLRGGPAMGAGGGLMGKMGGLGGIAKGLLKGGVLVSGLIGAVSEIFTNDIGAAFGDKDWIDKIGSVLFAGFRGIFTAFTGLFDSIFDTSLTNAADQVLTSMMSVWQTVKAKYYSFMESISFGDAAKEYSKLKNDAMEAGKKADAVNLQLEQDKNKTLVSIGKESNAALEKQKADAKRDAEATAASSKKIGENVAFGTTDLMKQVSATVSASQSLAAKATPGATQVAQIATPGQTPISAVVQPDVNKPKAEEAKTSTQKTAETSAANQQQLVVDLLQQQLDIARRHLDYVLQAENVGDLMSARLRGSLPSTQLLTDNFNNPYA